MARQLQQVENHYFELIKLHLELINKLEIYAVKLNKTNSDTVAEMGSKVDFNAIALQCFIGTKTDIILEKINTIGGQVHQEVEVLTPIPAHGVDVLTPIPAHGAVEKKIDAPVEASVETKTLKFWRETLYELAASASIVNWGPNSDSNLENLSDLEVQAVNNLYLATSVFNDSAMDQVLSKVDDSFLKK